MLENLIINLTWKKSDKNFWAVSNRQNFSEKSYLILFNVSRIFYYTLTTTAINKFIQ